MEYILITGAYGGMGRAAVQALRARGYGIFALDRKVEPSGDAGVIPIKADLTDAASVASAVAAVRAVTDRLKRASASISAARLRSTGSSSPCSGAAAGSSSPQANSRRLIRCPSPGCTA